MPLDPVLKKFIDEAVAKGRTAKDIGSSIAEAGWGSAHIQEAESYYNSKKKSSSSSLQGGNLGPSSDGENTISLSVSSGGIAGLRSNKKNLELNLRGGGFSSLLSKQTAKDQFYTEPDRISKEDVDKIAAFTRQVDKDVALYEMYKDRRQYSIGQGGREETFLTVIGTLNGLDEAKKETERIRNAEIREDNFFEAADRSGAIMPLGGGFLPPDPRLIKRYEKNRQQLPIRSEEERQSLLIAAENKERKARENAEKVFEESYQILGNLGRAGRLGPETYVPEWEDFKGNISQEAISWMIDKTGEYQEQELQKFKEKAIKEAESTNVASRWAVNMLGGMLVASEAIFSPLRQITKGYKTVYKEGEFFPTFEKTGYVDSDPDNIIGGGLFKKEKEALEAMDIAAVGEKILEGYSMEEIQKGVFGNLNEGNYKAAFGLLGMDAVEMVPQLLSAAVFKEAGLLAMGTSAAGKAWTRVDDNPAYSVAEKAVYSIIAGAAEYYTEKIFRYDRDLLSGALRFSRQTGKKALGDIMFGFLPGAARAIVEEGFEEAIVDVVTQGMEMAVEGKEFDGFQLADAALLGGVMGGGSFVLAKSPNVLGRIPGMRTRLEMDSEIAQIYQILSKSGLAINSPERINLERRLRDLLAEQKSRADKDMLFYGQYSQEDKEETYALQQSVVANMQAFRDASFGIGRKAIVEQIKADMAKIETIESKYDSQEKQQVSSEVAAGQELGGVQLDETGAQATETGGVFQESEQEKQQARQNADNLEQSQPARNPDSFTDVDSQGAENIRNTLYDFIKNAANTFFTNQSSKRQAARAAESITNIVKAINALGKKIDVSLFYTKESLVDYLMNYGLDENGKRYTEEKARKVVDESRGLYLGGGKGKTNIALFVPHLLANTAYHEGLHEVIPAVFGQKGVNILFNGIRRSLLSNPLLNEYFKQFGAGYKKGEVGEEFVVELASLIADGSVSVKVKRGIIDTFMEQFAKLLGLVGIDVRPTQGQFLEMLADLSEKIGSGEDIGEISKAFNVDFSKGELEEMANGDIESVPFITTNIVAPTNVKRHSIVFPKSGTYPLSKVTKSDVGNIVAFLKEEVRLGKTFAFWYSDQFGRGTYVDPYTKKEYFLDGGPSFMVDPENKKNGDVWSAGGAALTLYNILIESPVGNEVPDYVAHISGHPTKMMQYNRVFNKIWVDRARQAFPDINDFKAELTNISKIEGIMSFAENMTSWDEMLSGIESENLGTYKRIREAIGFIKESDIKISPPGKKGDLVGTRLYKFLDKYGLHPDNFDDARDGYYREYDFQEGEILNIYKPTEIVENAGIHGTYPNGIKGEPILIPDARIFSFDIMSEEVRKRRKPKGKDSEGNIIYGDELQNLEKTAIQKAMAPDTPTRYSITKDEKQIEKAAKVPVRKVKQMKIMTPLGSIPKLVESLDVLITPATTERVQYRVSEEKRFVIKDLSEKFDEAVKQGSASDEIKYGQRLEELGQEITEGARRTIKNEVAKHRGVAVQFGDNYIGSWNEIFEPSLNMRLILTPESNEQAISDMISRFAERYNQDAVIIEKRSYKEEDYKNNLINMPFFERDEGSNLDHYPQIFIEFEEKMTNEQVNALSLALNESKLIDSFSVNKNEIKISIIHLPFGKWAKKADESNEEYYKRKQENYEQQLREFQKIWNEVLGSNVDVRANIRIRQSYYYAGEEAKFKPKGYKPKDKNDEGYDIRRYSRDNFLKEFKTTLTSTEKKIAEYRKLREEEIILSEQKKKLPKDKQDRLDEIRKEVQPVIESTFAYNKTFFYALRRKLNEIAESFASKADGAFVSTFSIKRPSRAAVKALRWYFGATEELGDGARVNIIVENEDDANKIYELIQKEYPRKKNEERRVNESTELGYPKRLIEVSDIIDGFIAEIQVMTAEGYLAKDGVSWFNSEKRDEARTSLRKVQERLGWKIPDGLGHYFYEIHRDPNIDSKIRNEALRLSNDYYRAFTNKNSTLNEGSFMSDVIDFKRMVDKADKSSWDEGNKGKSPKTLDSYIRSRDGKKPIKRTKAQIISGKRFGTGLVNSRRTGKNGKYLELMSSWASESMKRAIVLEDKGFNPEQIYYQTGWERGADQVWRYEVEPIKLSDNALNNLIVHDEIVNLADLIVERPIDEPRTQENETVLDYYPDLKYFDVIIGPYGQGTLYNPSERIIQIDKNVVDAGMNEVYLDLVHEVQHAIQHIDNLNWGASPAQAKNLLEEAIETTEELRKTALIKSKELKEKLEDLYGKTLDDLTKESSSELSNFENYGSIARYNEYKTYVQLVESSQEKLGRLKLTLNRLLDGEIDPDDAYRLFAGEAEARNAEKRALMSKEERKATPFSMSEDRLRAEQAVVLPLGFEKPSAKVKRMAISEDIGKVKRMALGTTKGRLYAYLLGRSEKDVNGNVTMFVDRAEFIRVASSFMGAQEATDIYDNVANDNVPANALDPESYTGNIDKAYEDSKSKIERETNKAIFTIKNAIVKLLDRQHLIKAEVLKAGLQRAKNLIVNKAGASSRALAFVKSWESRIYKGLSQEENTLLDKIIVLRRISTIDANFAERFDDALAEYNDAMAKLQNLQPNTPAYDKTLRKALNAQKKMTEAKPPTHPENIDGLTASLELSRLQAEMGDEAFAKLNERADEYFDAFSSILDELYREGMISEKLYEQLAGLDYQPRVFLDHMFEDMDSNMMSEHRFTGPIIQRLKEGSDKEMLFNSRYLLRIYAKNAFTRMAKNKIHVELGKAADIPTNASWISKTAKTGFSEIVYYTQKGRKQGVQQKFYLRNDLYSSLNDMKRYGLLSPQAQKLLGIATFSRLLKMLATQLNPLFVVKNVPRDFTHILMFTDFYDNVPLPIAMFKLGMDYIRGAKSKITDDKWFKLYIKFGGGMEFLSTEGEESVGLGNPSSAQQRRMARLGMKASEVLTKGREYLGYLGELSEIAPRLGIFQSLVEKRLEEAGVDINSEAAKPIIEEAVALVREIIDFSQGGELTKAGESAIPYLNAAFQGFRVSTSYIANNPKQFAFKLAQLSVAIFTLALFNASLGDDDMEDISDEIKFRNWIILTPFKDKDGNRYYLKIAKTQQLQAFANLLEIGAEAYVASQNNRDPRINDDISKIALKTVGSYLPKDIGKLDKEIMTAVPVFASMYTYSSNYDAFRDQIVSRDYAKQTSQGKPSPQYEDLFNKDVPYFYKAIGQGLGLGPKRLQAATEKVITSPHSSLIVMGSYSILDAFSRKYELEGPNGMKIQDVQDISKGVGERLGADATKVFVGVTNPDTKSYRKREEVDKANIESNDRRLFLKKEADKWGEKLYNLNEQKVSAETYNRTIDSIKAEVRKLDEKDAEFFKNRINAVAKKGPDIPQQYNELMFAADDVARAKILYIYDQNMTDQEIYNYMGDYTSAVGRNINREQNIRIAKEYAKIKRDEEK